MKTTLFALNLCHGQNFHTLLCYFIPVNGYVTWYLNMNLHTWVCNLILGYVTWYLGTLLDTWVCYLILGYVTWYLNMNLHTWVWNFILWYESSYLGAKFDTLLQSLILGLKPSTYSGWNFFMRMWGFWPLYPWTPSRPTSFWETSLNGLG
jgi:hypothetical protein